MPVRVRTRARACALAHFVCGSWCDAHAGTGMRIHGLLVLQLALPLAPPGAPACSPAAAAAPCSLPSRPASDPGERCGRPSALHLALQQQGSARGVRRRAREVEEGDECARCLNA